MDYVFQKEYPILPSVCDASGRLSYPGAFECFMDIATQHADVLGVGLRDLSPKNLYWLTVKTKIVFLRRPEMGETAALMTWPEVPGRIRCMRSYEMKQGDEPLLCGKTEWAVVNTATGRMIPASEVFPNGNLFRQYSACGDAFTVIPDHFDDAEPCASYTVRSTDIDVGGHMNNAAYVRAIAGLFSAKAWQEMNIREMEVAFRAPCFEGNALMAQKRRNGDAIEIRPVKSADPDNVPMGIDSSRADT